MIEATALTLAHAHLYAGRPLPEFLEKAKAEELAALRRIGDGRMALTGVAPSVGVGTVADAAVLKTEADRRLGPTALEGYSD